MEESRLSEEQMKMAYLELENFNLKMKVYYTNKKVSDIMTVEEGASAAGIEDSEHFDQSAPGEENQYCRDRIYELEREILKVQLLRDNEALEYQKAMQSQLPSNTFTLLEESRRREREVAKAIAEHDASLIAKLQDEALGLQQQCDSDELGLRQLEEQCRAQGEQLEVMGEQLAAQGAEHVAELGRCGERVQTLQLQNTELTNKLSILQDTQRCQQLIRSSAADSDCKELGLLRQENGILRDQLLRQGDSIASQARALSQIQQAAQVMGALESSECERLGAALGKSEQEREKLQSRCGDQARKIDSLEAQLAEATDVQQKAFETSSQREAELWIALEGVVQRCQDMEKQPRCPGCSQPSYSLSTSQSRSKSQGTESRSKSPGNQKKSPSQSLKKSPEGQSASQSRSKSPSLSQSQSQKLSRR
ncbi:hypothetical protein B484DRAFT_481629 [Ochromonadaceae sp. CCMP2298]|nr:hypothetical protein B484DRAFT_481629 [Ochromonadaceae sp. CCMP2298]